VRYRIVAALIFLVALVGAKAALGTASPDTDAAIATSLTAQPTSTPPSTAPWDISGTIRQMNGDFWEIQGYAIRVTGSTQVTGDVPSNGVFIRAQGTVDSDGTWQATRIWVGVATTPTASTTQESASPLAPPTPTVTATARSTPSPTSTATPKPSATATTRPSTPSPVPPTATRSTATAHNTSPTAPTPAPHSHPGHHK